MNKSEICHTAQQLMSDAKNILSLENGNLMYSTNQ